MPIKFKISLDQDGEIEKMKDLRRNTQNFVKENLFPKQMFRDLSSQLYYDHNLGDKFSNSEEYCDYLIAELLGTTCEVVLDNHEKIYYRRSVDDLSEIFTNFSYERSAKDNKICDVFQVTKFLTEEENRDQKSLSHLRTNLGFYYQCGIGTETNLEEAFRYYELAANQGYVVAQYHLGLCYERGIGVAINHEKAFEQYEKSASYDFAPAQFYLGLCYEKGIGVSPNPEKALEQFEAAANGGVAKAQLYLGFYHQNLAKSADEKDREILRSVAFQYFKDAALQGLPEAQYQVALCYDDGIGVAKNRVKALNYCDLAAQQGNKEARQGLKKVESKQESETIAHPVKEPQTVIHPNAPISSFFSRMISRLSK